MNLSATLANFSFLILFISTLVYWIDSSNLFFYNTSSVRFLRSENEEPDLNLLNLKGAIGNQTALKIEGVNQVKGFSRVAVLQSNLSNFGNSGIVLSNISLFLLLCIRWVESGHFPLSNLYESLIFLSWALTLLHLIINFDLFMTFKSFPIINFSSPFKYNKNFLKLVSSIIAPSALFTNAFASFSLPTDMQSSGPLVPALQSNWLMMHVTVMVLSYAALIIGSLLSIGFLVISGVKNSPNPSILKIKKEVATNQKEGLLQGTTDQKEGGEINTKLDLEKILDNLSYRILGFGFPLLTIGILSGAVWANEAWGSYWSWDPKETWALLTWLIFAIYLHTRLNKGWEGKKPALIASFGFIIVWICFLGVNLLGEGLHSYGWLNKN